MRWLHIASFACIPLAAAPVTARAVPYPMPTALPSPRLSPERRAREHAFMRGVQRNFTANHMTENVLSFVGKRVAFICEIEEITRPTVVVGQCGSAAEPVDVYINVPNAVWHEHDIVRVLGVMDAPASWSDVSGHTIYYPFVNATFVDRLQETNR